MENLDINVVILSGTITTQPEQKYTKGGTCILTFRMMHKRQAGKFLNEYLTDVKVWGALAEGYSDLQIGERVLVQGFQESRNWDKEGKIYTFFNTTAEAIQRIEGGVDGALPGPPPTAAPPPNEDDIPF